MAKKKKKAEAKEEIKAEGEKPKENAETKLPEAEEEKKPTDYSKQTKVLALVMAVLIISTAGTYWLVKKDGTVKFQGITFSKSQEGNALYYKSLLGYATAEGEEIPFILKLRTSPEELAEIPVNTSIYLLRNTTISLSPQAANCSKTYRTLLDMSMTLKAFGVIASPATTDKDYAAQNNATVIDCSNSSLKRAVVIFKEGNTTKIYRNTKYCYIVELNNCEITAGYERFILQYIIDNVIKKENSTTS